jgi:hypothetical protein
MKPVNVHDENRLLFALHQSGSHRLAEPHRLAGAREKIGDGFIEAIAAAGNDRTRHDPGTVISTSSASGSQGEAKGDTFLENSL